MVRVNNLANDAASDQVKAAPDAQSFASPIALFRGDNSCSRGGSLPQGFDNNFSINGLDTSKGAGLKLIDNMPVLRFDGKGIDDNMPVLRFDSKGFGDNMPVLRPDGKGLDDNMPVLQFRSDDIYGLTPSAKPDCFIDLGIPDDITGNGNPSIDFKIPQNGWAPYESEDSGRTDRIVPDEDIELISRPRGSAGYGDDTTSRGPSDSLPALPLEGKSILELDPKINPRLGCALAVSGALHELDPSFPITNNNKQLAQLLKQHGYEAVPQDGALKSDSVNPGDVLIGQRPDGMPGHAAIYKGQGKIYENNSDTGTIIGDGSLDRFNDKMHDKDGRWNKNGFSDVLVYRKVPVVGMANY